MLCAPFCSAARARPQAKMPSEMAKMVKHSVMAMPATLKLALPVLLKVRVWLALAVPNMVNRLVSPNCLDANGNTFVLDMQSYYLVPEQEQDAADRDIAK